MKRLLFPYFCVSVLIATLGGCRQGNKGQNSAQSPFDTIPMLVTQIQECSRLYTTEYKIRKIVTHDDVVSLRGTVLNQPYKLSLPLGERKVAIPMEATLKAYIDFSQFGPRSVERYGNRIIVTLPSPKVVMTSSRIEQDGVREYVALTRAHYSDRELSQFEQQGREAILQSIPQLGILEQARLSAARLLIPIIKGLGFNEEDITIVFPDSFNPYNLKAILDANSLEKR